VDALAFPFGILCDIRAFLFLDIGAAWFGNGDFFRPREGYVLEGADNGKLTGTFYKARRSFKFWDSENNKLGDGRATYGFGWNFYLGPFQLTWSFARQLENTLEVCDVSGDGICDFGDFKRIDDPFHKNGTVTSFYIAREF